MVLCFFLEDSIIDSVPVKHFLIDCPKVNKVLPLLPINNGFLNCNSIHKLGIYSLLLFSCFLIFPNIKYLTVYTIIIISIRPTILTYDFQTRSEYINSKFQVQGTLSCGIWIHAQFWASNVIAIWYTLEMSYYHLSHLCKSELCQD